MTSGSTPPSGVSTSRSAATPAGSPARHAVRPRNRCTTGCADPGGTWTSSSSRPGCTATCRAWPAVPAARQYCVLADQVGRRRGRGRDAVLQVGLLDLPGDGSVGGRRRQRRIQLEGELALDAGQLRGKPAVEVRVGVRAGVDGDRAAGTGQGREAGRVGRCHQRPHVVRARERAGSTVPSIRSYIVQLWMKLTRPVRKFGSWKATPPVSRMRRLPNIRPFFS